MRRLHRRPVRRSKLFFFELNGRLPALLREVHRLARAYHWAERDILGLTLKRRFAYLILLEEEEDTRLLDGLGVGELER